MISGRIKRAWRSFLSGKRETSLPDHAVIVHFHCQPEEEDAFYELAERLWCSEEIKRVGVYDGHEIAVDDTDGTLYFYGDDADALFLAACPLLRSAEFLAGAYVLLRYGGINDPEVGEVWTRLSAGAGS